MPELTPEDRERIYDEERVRAQARAYFDNANPPRKKEPGPFQVCCGILIVVFVLMIVAGSCNHTSPTPDTGSVTSPYSGTHSDSTSAPETSRPRLKMLSSNFIKEGEYCVVSGEVKNTGTDPIKDVQAVTTFYDASGNVVKTDDAMIDLNPILPGQTSPWKTMSTDNPAIKKERTIFKEMFGSEIETEEVKR